MMIVVAETGESGNPRNQESRSVLAPPVKETKRCGRMQVSRSKDCV
jgi:hypothetical protein